ncbi:MAG: hypothetical protein M3519_09545, partial [Actinomycetota bacterium]|nr:hypothetical protein [Actinomycetota bacterium]
PADALPPTEEAVTLWRPLAAGNPAHTPDLARALSNLGNQLSALGRAAEVEAVWRAAVQALPVAAGAVLLLHRSGSAPDGHLAAAGWLVEGLASSGNDRALIAALHEQARRHLAADPAAFATHWEVASGGPAPDWLTVNPDLLHAAEQWTRTATYQAERDHLAAHLELLSAAADTAVTEALLPWDEREDQRCQQLRDAARTMGVEQAYRPLLLSVLADEFARADLAGQQLLLEQRRDDLLDDAIAEVLNELAGDEDDEVTSLQGMFALALLDLARLGEHQPALDALATPTGLTPRLTQLAHEGSLRALGSTAELALLTALDPADEATARLYLALAATDESAASAGDGDGELVVARKHLAEAIRLDPEQIPAWISQLAGLAAQRPAALRLIPLLAAALGPPTTATAPTTATTATEISTQPTPAALHSRTTASPGDRTVVLP